MHRSNVFAGPYLDRAGHLRQDSAWFNAALADSQSRAVPVWNTRSLIIQDETPRAGLIDIGAVPAEHRTENRLILLGRWDERQCFAYDVKQAEPPQWLPAAQFMDLREVARLLPAKDAGLLAYARAMVLWREAHLFCNRCGFATLGTRGGHVLICTNPLCRHEQFPRLDPAIIVLVSDDDRALLGRQASWPPNRYSTIAGFVEPGESLEDAVVREVYEETGIEVDAVAYQSSQPWPFPSSLMLGFTAHARSREIRLNDNELQDARWFSRDDVRAGCPLLPPSASISYRLIEQWFDSDGGRPLRELHGDRAWPRSR
jgi:NAD+ diphosphatase